MKSKEKRGETRQRVRAHGLLNLPPTKHLMSSCDGVGTFDCVRVGEGGVEVLVLWRGGLVG